MINNRLVYITLIIIVFVVLVIYLNGKKENIKVTSTLKCVYPGGLCITKRCCSGKCVKGICRNK